MGIDLAAIYAECLPRVYSFARRMLGDEEAARDLAQETFARAAARIEDYRGEGSPLSWLLAIARNLCLDLLRGRRERSFGDIAALVDRFAREPSNEIEEAQRRFYAQEVKEGCLVGLLQCLPFAQRCAFVLRLIVGLETEEVARVLGRSPNSARLLLSRARASMRAFLCENCSLMEGSAGACSCEGMIEFSLDRGLIARYGPGIDAAAVEAELGRFKDEAALYASLPEPAAEIARLIDEYDGIFGKERHARPPSASTR